MSAYLTDADVAEKLKIDEEKVPEWRRRYGWPHLKVGRIIRYTEADLRAIEAIHHVSGEKQIGLPGQTALSAARSR